MADALFVPHKCAPDGIPQVHRFAQTQFGSEPCGWKGHTGTEGLRRVGRLRDLNRQRRTDAVADGLHHFCDG